MNYYYDVFPKTVPADTESTIRIRGRFLHSTFKDCEILYISYFPYACCQSNGMHTSEAVKELPAENWHLFEDGTLEIKVHFSGEQEHLFAIQYKIMHSTFGAYAKFREKRMAFSVYSLREDLYKLQPFKGDFHIHTMRSDASQEPAYVAARYRQNGFDFVAITDHKQYAPSQEAIDRLQNVNSSFRLYHGEEIHAPDNPIHIVNFGASESVNNLYLENEELYRKEVQEYLEKIPEEGRTANLDYYPVASSEWVFDKIREKGGLSIYCHPYWYYNANVIPEALSDVMFERRKFDAFELIGGFHVYQNRSNNYQVNKWMEESAKGNRFPVVGVSDCHGVDAFGHGTEPRNEPFAEITNGALFTWYYTIIFAEKNEIGSLVAAVKDHKCVAVNAPDGRRPDVYGDLRLVKYATFLIHEFYPQQKAYCETEGNLMLDYLAGDDEEKVLKALAELTGRTGDFRKKCFPGSL